ncbi:SEP1 [Symbiodinium sp. CCMP2592]|nr:SEP1 [Symbiodinium sp. CCMP2592]
MQVVEADHRPDELDFMEAVKEITEKKSVPQVFVGGKFIPGGCDNIMDLREKGELKPLLQEDALAQVAPATPKTVIRVLQGPPSSELKMASGERISCEYFRGSGQHQAFVFYRSESNGSKIEVQPAAAGGLCYYPEANCELSDFSCCTVTSTVSKEADRCQLHNTIYCLAAIFLAFQLPGMCRRLGFFTSSTASEACSSAQIPQSALTHEPRSPSTEEEAAEEASESQDQEDSEEDEPESTDSRVCVRRVLRILACLAIMAFIAAEVYCAILIANATQRALTVPERNSMLAADAFLVPLVEIFQFLEDVVAVKISAAMVTGETHLVRHILIMGVVGGILCGTVAASIATAICSWPAAIQWILAPYSMHDSYLQCPLVPQGPAAADSARMYWLLQVWSWPLGFACRAIKGFLFGSGDIVLGMTVLGLANGMVSIGGVYLFFLPQPSLDSLGWISFACSGASFLILLAMFAARRDLRQRYGLRITRPSDTETAASRPAEFSARSLWKDTSREGFMAMILDVSAQMPATVGIYTAGTRLGLGAMYQISSLQAAFPQYGLAWVIGLTYILRLKGTQLVSEGEYEQFRGLFRLATLYSLLLIVAVAASVIPYSDALSFLQAEQACEYASDLSCLPHYTSIFGGGHLKGDTLQQAFRYFFTPVLIARCFYQVFKAGMYVCLDWIFMAKVGLISLSCIFVPAILVAVWGLGTPSAIFVAMYLPWLFMTGAFMLRTRHNIKKMLAETPAPPGAYDFDLFVLGGGSGGCAAALEAARDKTKKIAVADFVKPSPQGTTWGVGGTCVNVGCIPKKLMHIAATKKEDIHDLASYGFRQKSDGGVVDVTHDWQEMCKGIQGYIKESLNQGMLDGFEANGIKYYNKYAALKDRHTIQLDDGQGGIETVTANYIMLAAGGRPNHGGYPGADEHCISSDDLFWIKEAPGKTLVVGAAYIALECAGFLNGLGYDTTVMVRSMLLRGFDRECVDKIDLYMQKVGVKFIRGTVPDRFEKGTTKKVKAIWKKGDQEFSDEFDTVLLAIGRTGEGAKLGLENAGVSYSPKTGKVAAPAEATNVPNIYCIGDLVENRPELTPVAKVAGKKVVHRLFQGDQEAMNYRLIATTVFTPLEYGMCGLNEEQCKEKYGDDGYTSYTKEAKPLEWSVVKHRSPDAFFKVLVDNKSTRVVGFHVLGPNAGEITQAVGLAMKVGVTKNQLDDCVGIHPTLAETMTMLSGQKIEGVVCES